MSHNIAYSTADQADVLAYLGGAGLTADQRRRLAGIRAYADARQADLDRQGVDWGLPVGEALDHLLAQRTDSPAECAGNAYHAALQIIIDRNASDPSHLATWSKPATFLGLLGEELRRAGVPSALLPMGFLFAGPPRGFPHLPASLDGYPAIGHLPLAEAKPTADAYRAALPLVPEEFRHDLGLLVKMLDFEHEEWEYARRNLDWYTQDTLFFSLV
ncbi:DUF7691 family protein [Streptomyces albidoflavus]|uniref:DUF7691 family protein n=1 Tax=Streptomyces albidoflavus TaxID=1886 RepID=UPI000FF4A8D6|nr:hypothetical protein [Streptomyces albidoflavus]RWZ74264.1 hypothetical protein EQK42_19955 [Streptomyces albidoflavus]